MARKREKKCIIYANCQGEGISHFLRKQPEYAESYRTALISNFSHIQDNTPLPLHLFENADLFIYQPLNKKYGPYSSDALLELVPAKCKAFSFPYIYNDALWPFVPSGSGLKGGEILMGLREKGFSIQEIIDAFSTLSLDCEFERRFGRSISILEEHEDKTDVKVTPFILENLSRKKLFLSQSHPTSPVFIHCVNQILESLSYHPLPSTIPSSLNEVNYPQCWPITPYELEHFRFNYVSHADPGWKDFYAGEIEKFLMITT